MVITLLDGGEETSPHGLHHEQLLFASEFNALSGLVQVEGQGLLAQYVLAYIWWLTLA
jgi:hypothetical protein